MYKIRKEHKQKQAAALHTPKQATSTENSRHWRAAVEKKMPSNFISSCNTDIDQIVGLMGLLGGQGGLLGIKEVRSEPNSFQLLYLNGQSSFSPKHTPCLAKENICIKIH